MRYLFRLAMRNIMKARRRTVLTFLMLSFGVMVYLLMEGMLAGFDRASFQNLIDFETGHFKIRSAGFDEDFPYDVDNYISDTESIESVLSKVDFVTGYAPRIQFLAELDNSIDSAPVVVVGIDPSLDSRVFSLNRYIVSGRLEHYGALLGRSLARDMDLGQGDPVYLTFRDREGMFTSVELVITGLVQTADPGVNSGTLFMDIELAREQMGVAGATEISLRTPDFRKTDSYRDLLKETFPDLRVESWRELSTDFAALMATKRKAGGWFLLFIIVIALVGIINTLLMSVYEKQMEIGTLMALGMEKRDVRNLFLFEGFMTGLLGSLAGIILGTLINLYFIYKGIDYTALLGDNSGFNVMGVVKSVWVFPAYIKSLLLAVGASVAASWYPAAKVMRMEPVECLRTVQ